MGMGSDSSFWSLSCGMVYGALIVFIEYKALV